MQSAWTNFPPLFSFSLIIDKAACALTKRGEKTMATYYTLGGRLWTCAPGSCAPFSLQHNLQSVFCLTLTGHSFRLLTEWTFLSIEINSFSLCQFNKLVKMSWIEIVGFLTVLLFGLKCVWNLFQFIYTTFLGHLLKHNMDLSKCGPWAGITWSF